MSETGEPKTTDTDTKEQNESDDTVEKPSVSEGEKDMPTETNGSPIPEGEKEKASETDAPPNPEGEKD